ncbi:MAG TPA: rod shape-determining protein [Candidatus Vogelbacteria bacterium]|nr:rod shape-determining protein [Candidatus Vogelbacteria bacterium]
MLENFKNYFSYDIGVDLGTSSTLIYSKGKGIVLTEPSVVALNQKTGRVVAVGMEADRMIGRTPEHISAVCPLVNGVISNFEAAEEMLAYFLRKISSNVSTASRLTRPGVIASVPSGITNVERRAVRDVLLNAGAGKVYVIEEPMAAALGVKLPAYDPVGNMIIDVGGGITDVAVISLGGIVKTKNINIAGNKLNQDIITYVRDEFKIMLGEKTAEEVKRVVGSVIKRKENREVLVRGRDLITGLPREAMITDSDIREAIIFDINNLIESVKEVLELTPPEIVADIMRRGIVLLGAGSKIDGFNVLLEKELKIPIYLADDPETVVVRGAGIVSENLNRYQDIIFNNEDEIPPR